MKRLMRYGLGEYSRILRRMCLCGVSILRGNAAPCAFDKVRHWLSAALCT